jgi:hypothetical protein
VFGSRVAEQFFAQYGSVVRVMVISYCSAVHAHAVLHMRDAKPPKEWLAYTICTP